MEVGVVIQKKLRRVFKLENTGPGAGLRGHQEFGLNVQNGRGLRDGEETAENNGTRELTRGPGRGHASVAERREERVSILIPTSETENLLVSSLF